MTCRVVRLRPSPEQGDTLLVGGRPAVVLCLLRRMTAGTAAPARCAHDPPCSRCAAPLRYDDPARQWCCSGCGMVFDGPALAELARELEDGEPQEATH